MMYSRIVSSGSFLPPQVVTNDELSRRIATSDTWIRTRTGIKQRHIAARDVTASDLALEASRRALNAAGVTPGDVDLIIVATSTPDFVFPSTACLLQAKLGVKGCAAFDVQAVCTGFVYALATADAYIRGGLARTALVVGSEVFSRILDWNDRSTCVLFGDGAGAVVVVASDRPGIHASALHADGAHADMLSVPGSVAAGAVLGTPFLQMNGQAVFKFAVKVLDEVSREVATKAGLQLKQVDWLIPHQANVRIIEATAKKLELASEHVIVTVDQHANTSAASIPLAYDQAVRDGRIRSGHRVLFAGVGGGFTWGAVLATV